MNQIGFPASRTSQIDQFAYRLFNIERDRGTFDDILKEVLGYGVEWTIDQSDHGDYFLKISNSDGAVHTSEGMGEGLISLMYIIDALYDSSPGDTIVIDEPELSLHPQYQKNLLSVIVRYAADRQVVIATHSPYFIDLALLRGGMRLYRTIKRDGGSQLRTLSDSTVEKILTLLDDDNNPHVLGITAREILFSGDGVLLMEGQEDVVFLQGVLEDLGVELRATTYGWGVGGADKMVVIANMLADLGFRKVAGIFDADKSHYINSLKLAIPGFHFDHIPAKDIRTKKEVKGRPAVEGLLDDTNTFVREQHRDAALAMFSRVSDYITTE